MLVQSPASDAKHTCKQAIVCNKDSEQRCSDTEVNHLVESKNNLAFFREEPAGQILMMEKENQRHDQQQNQEEISYLVSQFAASIRTQAFKKFSTNSHLSSVMNVGTLATRFFTLAEASEELTILLLLCQACSNSVQTPSNFLTCKHAVDC